MYTLGIDFATPSGRSAQVDARDGGEMATAVLDYPHGVMDQQLPSGKLLPPKWALQHPQDYLDVFTHTVPAVMRESGIDPQQEVGIGIDFTASSPLPTTSDGTLVCFVDGYRDEPHADVKLWKHHASRLRADLINEIARQRRERWLSRYGGKYSSEWFFSKLLQVLQERPEICRALDTCLEAADRVVWQLTGVMMRNTCTAGYKLLMQDGQYPSRKFFADSIQEM